MLFFSNHVDFTFPIFDETKLPITGVLLFERHHSLARLLASQSGEVTGTESGAGMLETDTRAQRSYLYRLPIRRQ